MIQSVKNKAKAGSQQLKPEMQLREEILSIIEQRRLINRQKLQGGKNLSADDIELAFICDHLSKWLNHVTKPQPKAMVTWYATHDYMIERIMPAPKRAHYKKELADLLNYIELSF